MHFFLISKCNKIFGVYLLVLLILVCSSCTISKKTASASFETALDSLFASVSDYSGVLLVAEKGKPVYHKAFGYKNFNTKEAMSTSSIFEIASVSKQFTAMTIMMMYDAEKLNFDDPVDKYISGLPYPGITIRHLLNHTSGLPDYQDIMDKYWDKTKVADNADNIAYLIQYHPPSLFAPGSKYEYSNTGYMLLASITEKVSGQNFVEFCRQRFFVPYQMSKTDIRSLEAKKNLKDLALGHIYVKEKQRYVPADSFPEYNYAIWLGKRVGPGRVSATTEDLLKWDRALYGTKLVKPETLVQAFSPTKLNDGSLSQYGFGWHLEKSPKWGKIVRHSGDNPGYQTQFIRYIDADKTVILFCNNDHAKQAQVVKALERIMENGH
jgi:CubicO group peptidase (beta-lactamase class C family)